MVQILGRYTDAFKNKQKVELWKQCEKFHEDGKYTDAYITFMNYLNDEEEQNVFYSSDSDSIKFQLLQGSKEIRGYIDKERITAFALVAEFDTVNVAAMRRLLEMNFALYYTRYAIKDKTIVIKFNSSVLDGSPRKLYYALKEVATKADKQDDLLIDDFSSLRSIDIRKTNFSLDEKEKRYRYMSEWIDVVLNRVAGLNTEQMSGGISYLLLNLIYKIDYFLRPEGTLMYELEKMNWNFFNKDGQTLLQKIDSLITGFKDIRNKEQEKIFSSFYSTKSTFGIAPPTGFEAVQDVINANSGNIKWYIENSYEDIALSIYEYMAGYTLFSYGLPRPAREFLSLLIQALNPDICAEIGVKDLYYNKSENKFNRQLIENNINEIIISGKDIHPNMEFDLKQLKYDSVTDFAGSFYNILKAMNFN